VLPLNDNVYENMMNKALLQHEAKGINNFLSINKFSFTSLFKAKKRKKLIKTTLLITIMVLYL
jgi:hypothetical protein